MSLELCTKAMLAIENDGEKLELPDLVTPNWRPFSPSFSDKKNIERNSTNVRKARMRMDGKRGVIKSDQ